MFPGFVDSHLHLIGHGESNVGEWIIGEGWNENQLPDRKIFHSRELDVLAPNNPLILYRICRHALVANNLALTRAYPRPNTKKRFDRAGESISHCIRYSA
jgi:predicted amidohydrolase YtcJ